MMKCEDFYNLLSSKNISFYTGVPDSLLKDFCAYVEDNAGDNHIITANEGNAIALASGYNLATGNIPIVYLQNSGTGNTVNPLMSLTSKEVYSIPLILIIGWRGEPGVEDEPQHKTQGKVMESMLNSMNISYDILPMDFEEAKLSVDKAISHTKINSEPYVLLIKKGTFEKYELKNKVESQYTLLREDAIKKVIDLLDESDIIVSTTGKASRELFEHRMVTEGKCNDFLTVGSMGHASQIALGVALSKSSRQVYCFDGDGSVIMHMGSLAVNGSKAPNNFKHIILNNGSHDSVGGQPTVAFDINIPDIARACGYKEVFSAQNEEELEDRIEALKKSDGPALLEIRVKKGSRKNLSRPTTTPKENKENFVKFVND